MEEWTLLVVVVSMYLRVYRKDAAAAVAPI